MNMAQKIGDWYQWYPNNAWKWKVKIDQEHLSKKNKQINWLYW